ncbi:hypothetical protein VNO78_06318 [Psophocarpus tetragonolobus]|uniref:Uncharacterized protein n=1 Tax=Psophocarpus tetragonolobus TaxID=3891 RepID=A0AAN9STF5_PSOTE
MESDRALAWGECITCGKVNRLQEEVLLVNSSKVGLERDLATARTRVNKLEDEVKQLTTDKLKPLELERDDLRVREASLETQVMSLIESLNNSNLEIANQFAKGLNMAMEQVKCLAPELDLSFVGPFHELVNGVIIPVREEEVGN